MDKTVIPAFERNHLWGDAERLNDCGKFINAIECSDCKAKHFIGFRRCKNRFCTKCAYVRSLSWLAVLMPILNKWIEQGNYLQLLTLTVRDGPYLDERLKFINDAWRTFYSGSSVRKKWKESFPGGLKSLEVKIGKGSGIWHPHLHCLVMKDNFSRDYPWLKERWKQLTDDNGSVHIKGLNTKNLLRSAAEVVKYIIKPEQSIYGDDLKFNQLYYNLKGRRQISTWGLLRGIREVDLEEALETQDEKKLEQFVCTQCGCTVGELKAFLFDEIKQEQLFNVITPK